MRRLLLVPFAALGVCLSGSGFAQQFLLTVEEDAELALALVDVHGALLATTAPAATALGAGRFYRGERWASLSAPGVVLFDSHGAPAGAIPVVSGWNSMDVFPDGRVVVREPWASCKVFVYDQAGGLLKDFGFYHCPAGPDYGMRTAGNDEIWLSEECGYVLRRYDALGAQLGEVHIPGWVPTTWDDSCDDFVPAPDGSIWARQGDLPTVVSNYDWAGTNLSSFPVGDGVSGIALDGDGTIWALDAPNHALLHFDPSGASLGSVPLPTAGMVWSFDIRPAADAGTQYCAPANPNSTGASGRLRARRYGESPWLELLARDLPPGEPGVFLVSRDIGFVPFVGGGKGNLCLGGVIGRYVDQPWMVKSDGTAALTVDIEALPMPFGEVSVGPGETWHWQAWHRDHDPGPTSNLTDAITVEF